MTIYVPQQGGVAALQELDAVPWDALDHANGRGRGKERPGVNPFTKEPIVIRGAPPPNEALRDLFSDDEDDREEANDYLYSTLTHQGDLFEATAAAVPFLAALVADVACPSRGALVQWLWYVLDCCTGRPHEGYAEGRLARQSAAQLAIWGAFRASLGWLEKAREVGPESHRRVLGRMVAGLVHEEPPPEGTFADERGDLDP